MAYEEAITFRTQTFVAAADLSGKQYYGVANGATGIDVAVAGKAIDGILVDKPLAGKAGAVCRGGVCKAAITASTAVTVNNLLEVDTGGTFKVLAGGIAVAKALEALSSTAGVCWIAVELLPSNAAFA
jgi:hypothetical protein